MKLRFSIVSVFLLLLTNSYAQNVLNANSPEKLREMREKKYDIKKTAQGVDTVISTKNTPLPFGFIEDKDILWSKVTWEIIDLNERLNQIYYHSSDGLISSNSSLFDAIKKGMENGEITQVYTDEFFTEKKSVQDVFSSFSNTVVNTEYLEEMLNNGSELTAQDSLAAKDTYNVGNSDVRLIKIKGIWYLDKRLGELKYRLLGICMMGPDPQTLGRKDIVGGDEMIDLFWIWYGDARKTLSNYTVFNPDNNSSPITYDDLLNARRFSSIIYRSDNGFADGDIKNYLPNDSKAQLEESNRIKKSILEHENEMWNY